MLPRSLTKYGRRSSDLGVRIQYDRKQQRMQSRRIRLDFRSPEFVLFVKAYSTVDSSETVLDDLLRRIRPMTEQSMFVDCRVLA